MRVVGEQEGVRKGTYRVLLYDEEAPQSVICRKPIKIRNLGMYAHARLRYSKARECGQKWDGSQIEYTDLYMMRCV